MRCAPALPQNHHVVGDGPLDFNCRNMFIHTIIYIYMYTKHTYGTINALQWISYYLSLVEHSVICVGYTNI